MLGGRKVEDGKEEKKRQKQIEMEVTSIFLNNNEIRDIRGLSETLVFVMPKSNPQNLMWLNLSYNFLQKIDAEILNFPQLRSLNLHGNYISDLEEVRKLGELEHLKNLTLNGNPIEEIEGYRMYVLGLLFLRYESLRKLDSVYITSSEMDGVIVWNEHLYKHNIGRLKKLRPKLPKDEYGMVKKGKEKEKWVPREPPAKEEDENQAKPAAAGPA
jgi:Leucine-rich repeat (LRR) protein